MLPARSRSARDAPARVDAPWRRPGADARSRAAPARASRADTVPPSERCLVTERRRSAENKDVCVTPATQGHYRPVNGAHTVAAAATGESVRTRSPPRVHDGEDSPCGCRAVRFLSRVAHRACSDGAPRGRLRALCTRTLTGGLDRTRLGRGTPAPCTRSAPGPRHCSPTAHPAGRAAPRRPRALRRRPAGRAHPRRPGAWPHRQPVDLHRDAPQPAPPRASPSLLLELQPAAHRHRPLRSRPRRPRRTDLRADRPRPRAHRRAQPRRADRPLQRAAPGRRPAGRVAGDARAPRTRGRCSPTSPGADDPSAAPRVTGLQELAEPAPDCPTRVTAIYSNLDQIVLPASSGRCDHPDLQARNVLFRGSGTCPCPSTAVSWTRSPPRSPGAARRRRRRPARPRSGRLPAVPARRAWPRGGHTRAMCDICPTLALSTSRLVNIATRAVRCFVES